MTTAPAPTEHVILVAITVEASSRQDAMSAVLDALPNLGDSEVYRNTPLESWWIAEDDRIDNSDCDSAVFVHPGRQQHAVQLLHGLDWSAECNLNMGLTVNGNFDGTGV